MLMILYAILVLLLLYLEGSFIVNFIKIYRKPYLSIFVKLVIGLLITIILFSIVKSKFNTISIGSVIVIGFFICEYWKYKTNLRSCISNFFKDFRKEYKELLSLIILLVILCFYNYYFIFHTDSPLPVIVNWDNLYNANLSMFLNFTGKESLSWDYINYFDVTPTPYHYFEGWFVAFAANLFASNYYFTLVVVCIPILQSIIVLGIWAIMERNKISIFYEILAIAILFFAGWHGTVYNCFNNIAYFGFANGVGFNAFDEPHVLKWTITYIMLLCCVLFMQHQKYVQGLIFLLFLALASIIIAPVILVSIFLTLLILIYCGKYIGIYDNVKVFHLLYPIAITIFIVAFYSLQPSSNMIELPKIDFEVFFHNFFRKDRFIVIIEKLIYYLIFYSPYLIVLIVFLTKKNDSKTLKAKWIRGFGIFSSLNILFAIIIWFLFFDIFGASEFMLNNTGPVLNVLVVLLIYYSFIYVKKIIYKVFLFLFTVYCLLFSINRSYLTSLSSKKNSEEKYSYEYLNKVKQELNENCKKVILGARIEDHEEICNGIYFNPFINYSGTYLYGIFNQFALISLSHADIPDSLIEYNWQKNFISQSPFYKFVEGQKKANVFKDVTNARLDFVKKYNIEFIVLSKNGRLDNIFLPYIKKIIVDKKSQEKIVLLNINK